MTHETRNRQVADRLIEAAYINRATHGHGAWYDAEGYLFRMPAMCELAPITPETFELVASQQRILVAAELMAACRRLGWDAHQTLERQELQPWSDWVLLQLSGITVEVDYAHYWPSKDPNDLVHYQSVVSIDLYVNARQCGLQAPYPFGDTRSETDEADQERPNLVPCRTDRA